MKTLTFGTLSIEVDLDERGEDYLIEMIKEDIIMARKDFRYRLEHHKTSSILIENPKDRMNPQTRRESQKRGKRKA